MNLPDAVDRINTALATKEIIEHLTQYHINNGFIYANDGRLLAACPIEIEGTYYIPGKELLRATRALPKEHQVRFTEHNMIIEGSGFRAQIALADGPDVMLNYAEPDATWEATPKDLLEGFRILQPFLSTNATHLYSICICIKDNQMFATNNIVLAFVPIKYEVDTLLNDGSYLIPAWAIEFCLNGHLGELTHVFFHPDYSAFKWADGSWMKAQSVAASFPTQAFKIIDEMEPAKWEIPEVWRKQFNTVCEMSLEELKLEAGRITGAHGVLEVEADAIHPMPEGKEYTAWPAKFLGPVIAGSTHFDPDRYPQPAPFRGPNFRGVIIGRV